MMSDFPVLRCALLRQVHNTHRKTGFSSVLMVKTSIAKPGFPRDRESDETPVTAPWIHVNELSIHPFLQLSPVFP